jgi:hypothetical protein
VPPSIPAAASFLTTSDPFVSIHLSALIVPPALTTAEVSLERAGQFGRLGVGGTEGNGRDDNVG